MISEDVMNKASELAYKALNGSDIKLLDDETQGMYELSLFHNLIAIFLLSSGSSGLDEIIKRAVRDVKSQVSGEESVKH